MKFIIASVACLMTAQAVMREPISVTAAGAGGLDVYSSTENEDRIQELNRIQAKKQQAIDEAEFAAAKSREETRIRLATEKAQFDYDNSLGITHPFVDKEGREFYAVATPKRIKLGEVHDTYDLE